MSKEITPKKILNIISSTSNLTNEEKHELTCDLIFKLISDYTQG